MKQLSPSAEDTTDRPSDGTTGPVVNPAPARPDGWLSCLYSSAMLPCSRRLCRHRPARSLWTAQPAVSELSAGRGQLWTAALNLILPLCLVLGSLVTGPGIAAVQAAQAVQNAPSGQPASQSGIPPLTGRQTTGQSTTGTVTTIPPLTAPQVSVPQVNVPQVAVPQVAVPHVPVPAVQGPRAATQPQSGQVPAARQPQQSSAAAPNSPAQPAPPNPPAMQGQPQARGMIPLSTGAGRPAAQSQAPSSAPQAGQTAQQAPRPEPAPMPAQTPAQTATQTARQTGNPPPLLGQTAPLGGNTGSAGLPQASPASAGIAGTPVNTASPAASAGPAAAQSAGTNTPSAASAPQQPGSGVGARTTTDPQAQKAAARKALQEEASAAYRKGEYSRAAGLWQQLAREGDAQAMNNLGLLYDQGQGVEPDIGRAVHWFAQAAKTGHASGMSNYGRMLEQGRGMPANPQEAARWFDLAARKGQPQAQYNLGLLYEQGRGVPQDYKAAAAWYSRAAAQNQSEALARLGHFYRLGQGVQKDPARAALLLYAAAMQGVEPAMDELEEMARQGPRRPAAVLFGEKLDMTDRPSMRAALKRSGAVIKRQQDDFICDIYEAGTLVPGASEMALCYGPGKTAPLAFLKLDYPASSAQRAEAVVRMVESRFGPPSAGEGDAAHLWNLGSVLVGTQYMESEKVVSLMYMMPRVYHHTH